MAKTDLETTRECITVRAWLPCEGVDKSQRLSRRQGPSRVAPVGPWSSHPPTLGPGGLLGKGGILICLLDGSCDFSHVKFCKDAKVQYLPFPLAKVILSWRT